MISSEETTGFWFVDGVNVSTVPRIRRATMTLAFRGIKSELSLYSKSQKEKLIEIKLKKKIFIQTFMCICIANN
jgi:hypothetical protein